MVLALSEGILLRREHQASPRSCYGPRANCQEIAEAVGCHIDQVKRIKHNLHNWGTPKRPKFRSQGRPRSLTAAHVEVYVLVFFFARC